MITTANLTEFGVAIHMALRPLDDGLGGTPSAPAGLTANQVGPGFSGFVLTFAIAAGLVFLIRDMVKRMRRVKMRGESLERAALETEPSAADDADEAAGGTRETGVSAGAPPERPIRNHLKTD